MDTSFSRLPFVWAQNLHSSFVRVFLVFVLYFSFVFVCLFLFHFSHCNQNNSWIDGESRLSMCLWQYSKASTTLWKYSHTIQPDQKVPVLSFVKHMLGLSRCVNALLNSRKSFLGCTYRMLPKCPAWLPTYMHLCMSVSSNMNTVPYTWE